MRKKNKITAQIYKQLKGTAATLPPFQRHDAAGKPLYRQLAIRINIDELTEAARAQMSDKEYMAGKRQGYFVKRTTEPIMANHEVNLIKIYEREGMPAVETYINYVKEKYNEYKSNKNK